MQARDYTFKVIDLGGELIELSEDVVKDLSSDKNLLNQGCRFRSTSKRLRKVGKMGHSR